MILNVEQYRQFLNHTGFREQIESELVVWEPYLPQFYQPPHFKELKTALYELFIRTSQNTSALALPSSDPKIFEIYRDIFGFACYLPIEDPAYRDPLIASVSFLPYYFEHFQLASFDPENLILLLRESIQRLLQIEYFMGILLEKFASSPFLEMIQSTVGSILERIGSFPEGVADLLNRYQFKSLQEKIYSVQGLPQKKELLLHFLGQLDHFHNTYSSPSPIPPFGSSTASIPTKNLGASLPPAPRSNISSFPRPATARLSTKSQMFSPKPQTSASDVFTPPPFVPNASGVLLSPLNTHTPVPFSPQNLSSFSTQGIPPSSPPVNPPLSASQKLASLYPNLPPKAPSASNKLSALYPNLAPKAPMMEPAPIAPQPNVPQPASPQASVPPTPTPVVSEGMTATGSFQPPQGKAPVRDTKSIRPIKKASGKMTRKTSISQLISLQETPQLFPASEKKRLVLIDPNELQSQPLKAQLEQNGFEVISFNQGKKALDYLLVEHADLILSETLLDQIDGFTLFSLVKNKKGDKVAPFLFYSSVNDPSWIQQALQLGVKDYLLKPLHFDILLTKLSVYLAQMPVPEKTETYSGLSGSLKDAPLEDILQMVAKSSKENACIHLTNNNLKGNIYFKSGEILHAEVDQFVGLDALVQLLTWKEGNFYCSYEITSGNSLANIPLEYLLLDVARVLDERSQQTPPPES